MRTTEGREARTGGLAVTTERGRSYSPPQKERKIGPCDPGRGRAMVTPFPGCGGWKKGIQADGLLSLGLLEGVLTKHHGKFPGLAKDATEPQP